MADFTFLFNRKGAIYPIEFSSSSSQQQPQQSSLSSRHVASSTARLAQLNNEWPFNNLLDSTLVHLCCKVLVNLPPREFDHMTDNIPVELFVPLFKATLYPVRDIAIDVSFLFSLKFLKYQSRTNLSNAWKISIHFIIGQR